MEDIIADELVRISVSKAVSLLGSLTKPIEKNIKKFFKENEKVNEFEKNLIDYISQNNKQCTYLNTIAFQNTPKKLNDLYIPLSIIKEDHRSQRATASLLIDDECDPFKKESRMIIIDKAGMGKSTLSKKIILNAIEQSKYLPVLIELRKMKSTDIEEFIAESIKIDKSHISTILSDFSALYVFDGIDEMSNEIKQRVIKNIQKFSQDYKNSKILVTSREEAGLNELYDFARYRIKPLNEKEAYRLLEKYDTSGEIAKKLIEGIQESSTTIQDFLSTPLYVSLLFCAYRYKTVIPQKKHLFYYQVFEALFESHDLSKEVGYVRPKNCNLDITEFHQVLRRFAFNCLKNDGKIEFQKDELDIEISNIIKGISEISIRPTDFTKDLTTTVPLFVREGTTIRWSHKSLMEYFAAMFICHDIKNKEKQGDVLIKLYNSEKWLSYQNVLELCSDIDFSTFRSSLIKLVLTEFLNFNKNKHNKIKNRRITKSMIELRASASFGINVEFLRENNVIAASKMLRGRKEKNIYGGFNREVHNSTRIGKEISCL